MSQGKRILLIGSSNMDLAVNVCRVPEVGETLLDDGGVAYTPGGKGANSAIAITNLGGECVFATKLGADGNGRQLYQYYKERGLDTSQIKVDRDSATGFALIIKEPGGKNRIVYYPGANLTISEDNIREAFSCEPDALYIGFETSFETALAACRVASARGIPIFIDASPADKAHSLEKLPPLEVFSPNEAETLEYTGIRPLGADAALRACLALRRRVNAKYIVLKLGERGAFIYDGRYHSVVPAFPVGRVVDTTAAGDTFTAALTLEYMRTRDIKAAARFASAAGALAVTRAGASLSVPTRDEVLEFMRKYSTV